MAAYTMCRAGSPIKRGDKVTVTGRSVHDRGEVLTIARALTGDEIFGRAESDAYSGRLVAVRRWITAKRIPRRCKLDALVAELEAMCAEVNGERRD